MDGRRARAPRVFLRRAVTAMADAGVLDLGLVGVDLWQPVRKRPAVPSPMVAGLGRLADEDPITRMVVLSGGELERRPGDLRRGELPT